MKMTREQRYRFIEQAEEGEIDKLKALISACSWRQSYHIQPVTGLLNDPNGFSYYQGHYHLFYQWFPLGTEHGMKYWYHVRSTDLVNWEQVGIGIRPGDTFDSHGAYSGSGIVKDDKLHLLYTGNTRDEAWVRHPYQCLAVMDESGSVVKAEQPVISSVPSGYTEHFRDPKVWQDGDTYYCVIGAQRTDMTGCAVLYRSSNLTAWEFLGEIQTHLSQFGYMWECPDYFEMNGKGVLLFSPQGIEGDGDLYNNIFQSGYLIGELLNLQTREFDHDRFQELDRGFDFYAPQSMEAPDGRRILIGWMGLPEVEYPTDASGWAHCLTIPRQLSLKDSKLIQQPVDEMKKLRQQSEGHRYQTTLENRSESVAAFSGTAYELECEISHFDAERFGIEFRTGGEEKTVLQYDRLQQKLILDRTLSGAPMGGMNGTVRQCKLNGDRIKLQLFVDTSSVEIFVNDGEEVFTSRIFPSPESTGIRFFASGGKAEFKATKWDY